MGSNRFQTQQEIVTALKLELFLSPKFFLMSLARRFIVSWMLIQLICWFALGLSLLAQLMFNPEQFANDFATSEKIHHAGCIAAEVINDSLGIYGVLGGLIFVCLLTLAQAAEQAGYIKYRGN